MGVRGFIRDIITLYVVYKVIEASFSKTPPGKNLVIASLLLGGFTVWFLLEKLGILPKV